MSDENTDTAELIVTIDRSTYRVHDGVLSGAALRALPFPPIAGDRDLWQEGRDADRPVADGDLIELADHNSFFTSPHAIVAGGTRAPCHTPRAYSRHPQQKENRR